MKINIILILLSLKEFYISPAWSSTFPASLAQDLNLPLTEKGGCEKLKKNLNIEVILIGKKVDRAAQDGKINSLAQHYHCHAFQKHLKHDSQFNPFRILPGWTQILAENSTFSTKKIKGKIKYMGLIPLPYSYSISRDPITKIFTVDVKIYVRKWSTFSDDFKNMDKEIKNKFLKRQLDLILKEASAFWSNNSLGTIFNFVQTDREAEADFSIFMRENIHSYKYNSRWDWLPSSDLTLDDESLLRRIRYTKDHIELAHEMGHMLGFEDEYSLPKSAIAGFMRTIQNFIHSNKTHSKTLSRADIKALGCDPGSIMCKEWTDATKVHNYHLYLILNRYFDK